MDDTDPGDKLYIFQLAALQEAFKARGIEKFQLVRDQFKSLVTDAAAAALIYADDDPVKLTMLTFDSSEAGTEMTMATKAGRRMQFAQIARSITAVSIAHEQGREDWAQLAAYATYWMQSLYAELYGTLQHRHYATRPASNARRDAAETRRAEALAIAAELKRKNPRLLKDDIAQKLVDRGIYDRFSTARDNLREPKKR
jgi:hypothetical protein